MSENDFLLTDVPWDDDDELFDLSEPTGGKHHFAHLRLHIAEVTKMWTSGASFTIPGVTGGQFNDKDSNGNMLFKSYTQGGKDKLFIFVATKQDQEGSEYQIVKQLPNRKYRKGDNLPLHDIVMPSLRESLSPEQRNKLVSEGIYCEFDEVPTGETFTSDDGEDYEVMTWANFTYHENKESLKAVETEFFAQFQDNGPGRDYYPASWAEAFDSMLDWAKVKAEEIKDPKELAVATMLVVDENGGQVAEYEKGQPAIAIDGNEVLVQKVLSELLGVPEPMINL